MDRYLKILKSYKRMPLEMERTLIASVQRITVKRHEIIQQEGIYNDCIYFVEKGLFRIFSIESGNEITWRFKWEDDFIIALKHLAHGSTLPADSIDAVEDGILWVLPAALISELEKYLAFQFQYRLMIEKEMMSMIDAKRCSDPGGGEKNYRYLCACAPELAERVPLPYLANYTGIPEKVLGHLRATTIKLNFSMRRKRGRG